MFPQISKLSCDLVIKILEKPYPKMSVDEVNFEVQIFLIIHAEVPYSKCVEKDIISLYY